MLGSPANGEATGRVLPTHDRGRRYCYALATPFFVLVSLLGRWTVLLKKYPKESINFIFFLKRAIPSPYVISPNPYCST